MQSTPWAETFGMQTKWGVPKPSYRAFQLLAQLPSAGVPVTVTGQRQRAPRRGRGAAAAATATSGTVDVIAAVDDSLGTTVKVYALLTNYELNIGNTEDPTAGNPIATEAVTLTFTLPAGALGVSPAASLQLLDSTHGWAKPAWIAAGSPTYPNASQHAAEMAASAIGSASAPLLRAGSTLTLALPPMEPYAVILATFEYSTQ